MPTTADPNTDEEQNAYLWKGQLIYAQKIVWINKKKYRRRAYYYNNGITIHSVGRRTDVLEAIEMLNWAENEGSSDALD